MNPANTAKKNPPSWPVINKVPVITVGSIGNVSSDEKLMLIGIIGTITNPRARTFRLRAIESVLIANVRTAKAVIIRQPKQLILIINLKFLRLCTIAPETNDATSPNKTVTPHSREVSPVPNSVWPKIVPRTDPNPIKLPSMQKKAMSKIIKFLDLSASLKFTINVVFFGSCIATKLGGNFGFSRMIKKRGTVILVIQMF
jgi:hypothetical protein